MRPDRLRMTCNSPHLRRFLPSRMNHLRISSSLLLLLAAVTASAMRTTQDELVNFGTTGVNEEVRKNVQFNGLPNGVRYEVKERLSKEFKVENEKTVHAWFPAGNTVVIAPDPVRVWKYRSSSRRTVSERR